MDISERKENKTKERKESTLPEQIGFVCVCITVLLFIMLVVQKIGTTAIPHHKTSNL